MSNSLRPPGPKPAKLLCPWGSPGKNTEIGCHALLQGIFPTQGLNSCLLHWHVDSLLLAPPGKPVNRCTKSLIGVSSCFHLKRKVVFWLFCFKPKAEVLMMGKQLSLVLFFLDIYSCSTDFLGTMGEEEESCDPDSRVPCRDKACCLPGQLHRLPPVGTRAVSCGHDESALPGNTQRPKNQNTNSRGPFQTKLLFFWYYKPVFFIHKPL